MRISTKWVLFLFPIFICKTFARKFATPRRRYFALIVELVVSRDGTLVADAVVIDVSDAEPPAEADQEDTSQGREHSLGCPLPAVGTEVLWGDDEVSRTEPGTGTAGFNVAVRVGGLEGRIGIHVLGGVGLDTEGLLTVVHLLVSVDPAQVGVLAVGGSALNHLNVLGHVVVVAVSSVGASTSERVVQHSLLWTEERESGKTGQGKIQDIFHFRTSRSINFEFSQI
jgi:hypothetical protein